VRCSSAPNGASRRRRSSSDAAVKCRTPRVRKASRFPSEACARMKRWCSDRLRPGPFARP
jgi:hypothetical protein